MLKKLLLLTLLSGFASYAQPFVTISNTQTPTELINNVLFNSDCAVVTNVTSSAQVGLGTFNANMSGFPFTEGIILLYSAQEIPC